MTKRDYRKLLTLLRIGVAVGLIYYVLTRTDAPQAMRLFLGASWLLGALFLQTVFGGAIEALRLRVLFRAAGLRLGFSGAYRVVLIGSFFNFCVPGGTGGDVVKLYYLAADNRHKGVEVATLLLMDRAIALGALVLLILVLAALNAELIVGHAVIRALTLAAAVLLAALAGAAACLGSARIRRSALVQALPDRIPLGKVFARAAAAVHMFRGHKLSVLGAGALSLAGHVGVAMLFALIGHVVLPTVPALLSAFLALIGLIANVLPITPGGLGVGEAAFDQLFSVVGARGGAALLMIWRLGLLPFGLLGGVTYMIGDRPPAARDPATPSVGVS